MQEPINYVSQLDEEILLLLLQLGREFRFDPGVPLEMEKYFLQLAQEWKQTNISAPEWFLRRVMQDFRWLNAPPEWVQGAEWPVYNNNPMMFIGQIEVPRETGLYASDSAFFVFLDRISGITQVVVQFD